MPQEVPPGRQQPTDRILAGAAQVFAEEGFDGARVDEIARRAGINKAMLYYHVGDKATLYGAVVVMAIDRVRAAVSARLEQASTPQGRIRAIQGGFVEAFSTHPQLAQIMMREFASSGVNLPEEAVQRMGAMLALTREVVIEGRERGAFRDVNPLVAHLVVVGSTIFLINAQRLRQRFAAAGILPPEAGEDFRDLADSVTDIILNGLAREGAAP